MILWENLLQLIKNGEWTYYRDCPELKYRNRIYTQMEIEDKITLHTCNNFLKIQCSNLPEYG